MFQGWEVLLTEIWALLALAALVGLCAGWLFWGGRSNSSANADEIRRLRMELDREKSRAQSMISDPIDDVPPMQGGGYVRPDRGAATQAEPVTSNAVSNSQEPTPSADDAAAKPIGLDTPRDGLPDDLTKIKGIGPKMEMLCNRLGFWHFDQIANWNAEEIAWVDDNLEGFKGRVSRENWVAQAKELDKSEAPTFVRRKD